MDNQAAINYIHQCLMSGVDEMTIRRQLAASGWTAAAIDQAFLQYRGLAAVPTAVAPPVAQSSGGHFKKRFLIVALILCVLVGGAVFTWKQLANTVIDKTAQPALQQHAEQTTQALDIQSIASKVGEYVEKHSEALPTSVGQSDTHTLLLCGTACDSNAVSVPLQSYAVNNVRIHGYEPKLQVPNVQTVYLVANASCMGDGSGIGSQSSGTQPTMVFLYAVGSGTPVQHCTSL